MSVEESVETQELNQLNLNQLQFSPIDESCKYLITNKLVRVQYPAVVKNVDKAVLTLGGLAGVERAVTQKQKLQINFHPNSIYNKGAIAECDSKPGILLKVHIKAPKKGNSEKKSSVLTYDIVGYSTKNYTFNKLIDFQYLPLVAKYPETPSSTVTNIYKNILPDNQSNLLNPDWWLVNAKTNMPLFITPPFYTRFDTSKNKLYVNPQEKYDSIERPGIKNVFASNQTRTKKNSNVISAFNRIKQKTSIFLTFDDEEVPTEALNSSTELIKRRNYQRYLLAIQQCFEDRPIWSKAAVRFKTQIPNEPLKYLLPAVSFYFSTGPWRSMWVRFGYDPRKDPNARIFQTLDFRLRLNYHIAPKRSSRTKNEIHINIPQIDNSVGLNVEEREFILRPTVIPPARQMFYQYCDILIPEIQTMLSRLPPVPSGSQCHYKNGWLPISFVEQCREIVYKCVNTQVEKEILERTKKEKLLQDSQTKGASDYCTEMISNIKKGIYKEIEFSNNKMDLAGMDDVDTPITEILDTDEEIEDEMKENFKDSSYTSLANYEDNESLEFSIDMDALEDVKHFVGDVLSFKNKEN